MHGSVRFSVSGEEQFAKFAAVLNGGTSPKVHILRCCHRLLIVSGRPAGISFGVSPEKEEPRILLEDLKKLLQDTCEFPRFRSTEDFHLV